MSPPAFAATLNRPPAPDRDTNPMNLHPDVLEAARQLGITRSRSLENLRSIHARIVRRSDRMADGGDPDMVAVLVMTMGRSGSVPVDRMAERIVSRRINARSAA